MRYLGEERQIEGERERELEMLFTKLLGKLIRTRLRNMISLDG